MYGGTGKAIPDENHRRMLQSKYRLLSVANGLLFSRANDGDTMTEQYTVDLNRLHRNVSAHIFNVWCQPPPHSLTTLLWGLPYVFGVRNAHVAAWYFENITKVRSREWLSASKSAKVFFITLRGSLATQDGEMSCVYMQMIYTHTTPPHTRVATRCSVG